MKNNGGAGGRRAFLFTMDALLSLALLYSVTLAFVVYSQQPPFVQRPSSMQALARDFLVANSSGVLLDENVFYGLTLFNVTMDPSRVNRTAKIIAHADLFSYGDSCCPGSVYCSLSSATAACLVSQETVSRKDAWAYFLR